MSDAQRIPATRLRTFTERIFAAAGYSEVAAERAADVLLWASLRGVDTHGVRNLKPYYWDRIVDGQINVEAQLITEQDSLTAARCNGQGGMGIALAHDAMNLAICKAADTGVGIVNVRNLHHLGPAGYFANLAVRHGMLGICMTGHFFGKGHPIGVAPINGAMAMFSTNPLSFAVPCGKRPTFLLDMSTSVCPVNRAEMYGQAQIPIPDGWAKDAQGRMTNDGSQGRIFYPLGGEAVTGGYKGVGLSMLVSILSGVLSQGWDLDTANSDSAETSYHQATMGHFFAAIKIDSFMPFDRFKQAMDAFVDSIQTSLRIDPDQPIHYPGFPEHSVRQERIDLGIPADQRLLDEFGRLAKEANISCPL